MKQIYFLIIISSFCELSIADPMPLNLNEMTQAAISKLSAKELCENIEDKNFKSERNICITWEINKNGTRDSCLEWGTKVNKENYANEFKNRKYPENKCSLIKALIKKEKEEKYKQMLRKEVSEKACKLYPSNDLKREEKCLDLKLINKYIQSNSLDEYGFGDIKVGQTLEEASKASGVDIKKYYSYSDGSCGSYVFGEGGFFNVGKVRFLTTGNIIKRIDIWDVNINSIFKLKLRAKYKSINKLFVKSMSTEANHYGGRNHLIQLQNSGLILRVHTVDGIVNSFAIGVLPEVNFIEGCA